MRVSVIDFGPEGNQLDPKGLLSEKRRVRFAAGRERRMLCSIRRENISDGLSELFVSAGKTSVIPHLQEFGGKHTIG